MAELNLTAISQEDWQSFIKDIVDVQNKHKINLIPTFKWNSVEGYQVEWGGIRQHEQVPETKSTEPGGDSSTKEKRSK